MHSPASTARLRTALRALTLALPLSCPAAALADAYPSRPITVVVPFSAGGDADMAARNLSAHLRGVYKAPLVVMNKGGANGAVGSQFVREAPADGYTLLLARVGSQAILPALQSSLSYRWDDFTILGLLELNPMACVVNASSPYRTLKELTAAIKARPGKLNYSTSGPATALNLAVQTLLSSEGLPRNAAVEIPYKGGGDATTAVLAGEVDFTCNNVISLVGPVKGGTLRALVATSPERLKDLPDTPTARELGVPRLEAVNGWSALYGPKGLPEPVRASWAQALGTLRRTAPWRAAVENMGSIPRVMQAEETGTFVGEQVRFYEALGKTIGLQMP
ncbi:Bug family tripartite tricarboxylate transporter substrate binding protein [Bordetella genomosp. 13]|uniref:Bug family tripartite tricarboxylate transporter substrate binding protein n=1 Tax=Bordetella genomosp. 13 TaxID=463040 RepID=UPI00119F8784|nr:tripartite tricarboxylate transporter substrate binding protein [Bordetella genomosp. 13]